jgi:hypothetical protein
MSTMRIAALTGQMTNWQLFGPVRKNWDTTFYLST